VRCIDCSNREIVPIISIDEYFALSYVVIITVPNFFVAWNDTSKKYTDLNAFQWELQALNSRIRVQKTERDYHQAALRKLSRTR